MPVCCAGLGSLGSLRDARRDAGQALAQMQQSEKLHYAEHKDLRELLSARIGTAASMFELMDTNGNGSISRDEFHAAMTTLAGDRMFPSALYDELFSEFDVDDSGEISYKEYFQYVLRDSIRRKATLFRDFFMKADTSGDCLIDRNEFRRAVALLHGNSKGHEMDILAHSNEIDEIFDDMDRDKSGTLTLQELHKHLRCGVGMGKFVRPRGKLDTMVLRTKSSSRLRGSLADRYLMSPHNGVNAAYFDRPMDHHPKYVARTAVAKAAYELVVDDRFDQHLDSGARISLPRGGAKPLSPPLGPRHLHPATSASSLQAFDGKLSPLQRPFAALHRPDHFPPPPSAPARVSSPLQRIPLSKSGNSSLASPLRSPSPLFSRADSPPSPLSPRNHSFALLQALPISPVPLTSPMAATRPLPAPWQQAPPSPSHRIVTSPLVHFA